MGLIRFEPVRTGSSRGYSGFAFFFFFFVPCTPPRGYVFFLFFFCSVGGLEDRGHFYNFSEVTLVVVFFYVGRC